MSDRKRQGALDEDASRRLDGILDACPDLDASQVMSSAIRFWHLVAMGRADIVLKDPELERIKALRDCLGSTTAH